jgi:hypothetical protein
MCVLAALIALVVIRARAAVAAAVTMSCPFIAAVPGPVVVAHAMIINHGGVLATFNTVRVTGACAFVTLAVAFAAVFVTAKIGVPALITGTVSNSVPVGVHGAGIAVGGVWSGAGFKFVAGAVTASVPDCAA